MLQAATPPGAVPAWLRLAPRLAAVVTSLALAVWGAMAFLALRAQAAHQEEVVASVVALLSDNVRSSTHEHMLKDRRDGRHGPTG